MNGILTLAMKNCFGKGKSKAAEARRVSNQRGAMISPESGEVAKDSRGRSYVRMPDGSIRRAA